MDFQNYKKASVGSKHQSQFNMSFAQLQNSSSDNAQLSPQQELPNSKHMQIIESVNSLVEASGSFPGLVNDSFSLLPSQYDALNNNLSLGSP